MSVNPGPDPSAVLLLRGPAHGAVRPSSGRLVGAGVIVAVALGFFAVMMALGQPVMFGLLEAVLFLSPSTALLTDWLTVRRAERRLAATELWMSPHGVAYACASGHYGVPWPAVQWVGFRDGALCVDAVGWGGPVTKVNKWRKSTRSLRLPLAGADPRAVAQAVHAASGRSIVPS